MININYNLNLEDLKSKLVKFIELSGEKILLLEKEFDSSTGSPVFTVKGKYTSRGWTEWTRGFRYGSALLQFDLTDNPVFLNIGKEGTLSKMPEHISHTGVHDHGFNNISTYGNLLRLMNEGKIPDEKWEKEYYKLALKISGAIQASRWTNINDGGFIYSFNGPHSLFVDTIRTLRVLISSHLLGHVLLGENDSRINLMERATVHLLTTARYAVYYGEERDRYDIRGRTAHECIFNINNGTYRSSNAQQGYSGRTTWMRGLAWAMLGFSEELELFSDLPEGFPEGSTGRNDLLKILLNAAAAVSDFYILNSASDGIPYWDSGAPGLSQIKNYADTPADPFNSFEPVDSSAAVIAAQGLMRLGRFLINSGSRKEGDRYFQAGLTVFNTLLSEPYLSVENYHHGLILHSIYHYPNNWDHRPDPEKVPYGEASMWGDYHARELALYCSRILHNKPYYTFYNGLI